MRSAKHPEVGDDARVRQIGEDARLPHQAIGDFLVPGSEDLDRRGGRCEAVARAKDHPHSSRAGELLEGEPAANHGSGTHSLSVVGTAPRAKPLRHCVAATASAAVLSAVRAALRKVFAFQRKKARRLGIRASCACLPAPPGEPVTRTTWR